MSKSDNSNQDRQIRLANLRDRFKTATSTARETPGRYKQRISGQTVRRRLKQSRLTARRPYRGPVLTRRHRTQRLQWARGHLQWNRLRWRGVLSSDESRFHLSRSDGRTRIWRLRGERYASCCVEEVDRFGGGSLMIWTAVSFHYKSRLHFCNANLTAQRYWYDILIPYVAPTFANHPDLNVFQQDNARPHTARISQTYLNNAFAFARPCSNWACLGWARTTCQKSCTTTSNSTAASSSIDAGMEWKNPESDSKHYNVTASPLYRMHKRRRWPHKVLTVTFGGMLIHGHVMRHRIA